VYSLTLGKPALRSIARGWVGDRIITSLKYPNRAKSRSRERKGPDHRAKFFALSISNLQNI
jgi:hypothetical protein